MVLEMEYKVGRRQILLGAAAAAAAPMLATVWGTPAQAAPAEGVSAPAAARGAAGVGPNAMAAVGIFAVQHGQVWRSPVRAGVAVDPNRGGVAVIRGGTRDGLQVQLRMTQKEMVLPPRGFAPDWTFTPGDLVLVNPDRSVVEPLTRVVAGAARTEVWAPNLTRGPRLAAVVAA